MDYNLLGSSVHGVLQARILEWVVIPFSEGSSQPGSGTWVSCIAGRFFTREADNLYHIEFSYLLNGSHSFWIEDLKDDFLKRNEGRKALECFSEYVIQKFKYSSMILCPKSINQTRARVYRKQIPRRSILFLMWL